MKIPGLLWGFLRVWTGRVFICFVWFYFHLPLPGSSKRRKPFTLCGKAGRWPLWGLPHWLVATLHLVEACEKTFPWRDQRVLLRVWATSGSHSQPYLRKFGRPSWLGLAYPGSLVGLCYGCLAAWEQVNGREEGLTASLYTYEHEERGEAGHCTMCLSGRRGPQGGGDRTWEWNTEQCWGGLQCSGRGQVPTAGIWA